MSLYNYLNERYTFSDNNLATKLYKQHLERQGSKIIEKPYGFITYKFQGDACIISDIFTTAESRKTGQAWNLFKAVKNEINKHPECAVIIGFSEHGGQNAEPGIGAMIAAGFTPAYELKEKTVYMRGTY